MDTKIIIISPPEMVRGEITKLVSLFKAGLQQFHIRKPDFSDFDMINYITSIPKEFHKYLVLHSHYYLAEEQKLKGIQVGIKRVTEAKEYEQKFSYVGYSAHSFQEIEDNKGKYNHFFLSPIYDSISKGGYQSNFTPSELHSFLINHSKDNIIALGGIDESNAKETLNLGFKALALLGSIWHADDVISAFTKVKESIEQRPFTLTIAGFDPCSGAGLTADIKTFEQHQVQGLAITTAITYQNDSEFLSVDWLTKAQIEKQLNVLLSKYNPKYIKIGLVENFKMLKTILDILLSHNRHCKIIWDPVLKASANFNFHSVVNKKEIAELLERIYLVTPNLPECKALFGSEDEIKLQSQLKNNTQCNILLKGGHSKSKKGTDILIDQDAITQFEGEKFTNKDKHGTGCVISSAICANLAKGLDLKQSVEKAKKYVEGFITSNDSMLGYHNLQPNL